MLGDNRCSRVLPASRPVQLPHVRLDANSKWLGPGGSDAHGYSVFADVIGGKDVVEAIAAQGKVRAQGGLNYLDPVVEILSVDA